MANHLFTLKSGRRVGVSAAGDPIARRLIVLCHPTPGAGGFDPDPVVTSKRGLHLIMLDRPGYGASEPLAENEEPSVQARADDLAEFLGWSEDEAERVSGVDYGTIGVVGWGSGGAVALSLAARHTDRVDRVAIIGLPKPGGDGPAGSVAKALGLSAMDAHAPLSRLGPAVASHLPAGIDWLGVDGGDRALERPGVRGRLERMVQEAELGGAAGVVSDLLAFRDQTWAAELGRIEASTQFVYGDEARTATIDDGHWYQRHVPKSTVARVVGGGELSIVTEWSRILDHVAPESGDDNKAGRF